MTNQFKLHNSIDIKLSLPVILLNFIITHKRSFTLVFTALQHDTEGISSYFIDPFFIQLWRPIHNSACLHWVNAGHPSTV